MAVPTLALLVLLSPFAGSLSGQGTDDGHVPDFAREVRPLLARRCFPCHGNDEATREAGLRLDLESEAKLDRDGFAAIVAGDLDESEAWARITDDSDPMPPEDGGEPLSAEERDLVRRWIEAGAEYAPHWAFTPPVRPAPPAATASEPHAIDAFVRAALLDHGLDLSAPADDYTLLRRVSLDLTGLPPSPQTARAYAASDDPAKFEKAVDRLLASPAYAERWAAVWLDLARYADSSGHGSDPLRTIWRYRDWVIEAYDSNMPFDEFTIQQLAGDLLPDATIDTRLATAFHRNTMTNTEGGTDDEEFRVLAVKDRVNTTMQVWLGLTAGCAECHSHKYDPISHTEYYQLFDLFNQTEDADKNDDRPRLSTPTKTQQAESERLTAQITALDTEVADFAPDLMGLLQGVNRLKDGREEWRIGSRCWDVDPETLERSEAPASTRIIRDPSPDGRRVDVVELGDFFFDEAPLPDSLLSLRLTAFPLPDLRGGGPGQNPGNGNFVITDLRVERISRALPPHAQAARIRIELPGSNKILSLAEVEVLDANGDNVALGGAASQSSTSFGGPPALAIDGDRSGVFAKGSVTHTAVGSDPWWEVELERPCDLREVRIWNRTSGSIGERLAGMVLVVIDAEGNELLRTDAWPAPSPDLAAHFGGVTSAPLFAQPGTASAEQAGFTLADAFDDDPASGWAIAPDRGWRNEATIRLPLLTNLFDSGDSLRVTVKQEYGSNHTLGSYAISAGLGPSPPPAIPGRVLQVMQRAFYNWTESEREILRDFLVLHDPALVGLHERRAVLVAEREAIGVVTTPVMVELPADQRRATHIMLRGNFLAPDAQVHAAVPAAFTQLPADVPADRLAFARWLVDDANPLTARVAANRVWGRLFGRGIVLSEGDFGSQGATPSHPDLLDWLAVEYRENGWDQKALLRTIVSSRAYRQSSDASAASLETDPDAVWLSRYPRQRLEAEMVRDVTLQAAGLLSAKRFGPSVFPPQPAGLWQAAFNGQRDWTESVGEDRYRRGVYVFLRRTMPFPMLTTFDAPSRETCTVARIPTNTPLQAFVTMNDPAFHEAAQTLGKRCGAPAAGLDLERFPAVTAEIAANILWAARSAPPSEAQVETLCALFTDARIAFAADRTGAVEFSGWTRGQKPDAVQAAAWTLVAGAALNMDAVLTKE